MTSKSKTLAVLAVLVLGIGAFLLLNQEYHITGGHGRAVDALIAKNVAARGGADAWHAVNTLRLEGQMDLGQDVHVPYVMEQKRPGKMCLEFEFDNETATQCVNGKSGWKLLPFMGRHYPEPMTEEELAEMAGAVNVDGLLFDSDKRGYEVVLLGQETVDGKSASKLEVTLPSGTKRWVYLDDETGLEIKLEAMRALRGQERLVSTYFFDWRDADGLLVPRRQETRMQGDAESHLMTVESITVNPPIDDERFAMPGSSGGDSGGSSNAS